MHGHWIVGFILFRVLLVSSLTCLDDEGESVDWFIGYKFAKSYEYAYLSPSSKSWRRSSFEINTGGMLKNTFTAMYSLNGKSDAFYGVYNDEWPDTRKIQLDTSHYWWGHMKGAVAFDLPRGGIWIIHSIPKLSELNTSYQYPHTGWTYGQHFFCTSLQSSSITFLIQQLAVSRPLFQDFHMPTELASQYRELESLFHHKHVTETLQSLSPFTSAGKKLEMKHFSKSSTYGKDLYASFVAPSLGVGLQVESWRHGNNEPSECNSTTTTVYNIESLFFKDADTELPTMEDHAKWAVTLKQKHHLSDRADMWVCLGDINRQYPQFHRGGGTMCIKDPDLWAAFDSLITQVEPCKRSCTPGSIVTYT